MKKVILIGDSIRLGYDKYVKELLSNTCDVYSPEQNCGLAEYTLRFLHEWSSKGNWPKDIDLVHWNAGLWDVLRLFDDEPMTPKDAYANFIERIYKRIKLLFPNAKVVFATSTSVVEEGYKENFKRYNSEIEQYNEIAIKALSNYDCEINDLYEISRNIPAEARSDMTHFNTSLGNEIIGGEVVKFICSVLGISAAETSSADSRPTEISKQILGY